jgi:hypothetical protein
LQRLISEVFSKLRLQRICNGGQDTSKISTDDQQAGRRRGANTTPTLSSQQVNAVDGLP